MKPPGLWEIFSDRLLESTELCIFCFYSSWGSDICSLFVQLLVGHSVLNSELILSPSLCPSLLFFFFDIKVEIHSSFKVKVETVFLSPPLTSCSLIPNLDDRAPHPGSLFGPCLCFIVCRAWRVQTDLSPPGPGKARFMEQYNWKLFYICRVSLHLWAKEISKEAFSLMKKLAPLG